MSGLLQTLFSSAAAQQRRTGPGARVLSSGAERSWRFRSKLQGTFCTLGLWIWSWIQTPALPICNPPQALSLSLKRAWGERLPPRIRVDLKENTGKALAQPQRGLRRDSRLGLLFPHQSPALQRPWFQAGAEPPKGIWKMASKGRVGCRE